MDGSSATAFGPTLNVERGALKLDGWWSVAYRVSLRTFVVRDEEPPSETTVVDDVAAGHRRGRAQRQGDRGELPRGRHRHQPGHGHRRHDRPAQCPPARRRSDTGGPDRRRGRQLARPPERWFGRLPVRDPGLRRDRARRVRVAPSHPGSRRCYRARGEGLRLRPSGGRRRERASGGDHRRRCDAGRGRRHRRRRRVA